MRLLKYAAAIAVIVLAGMAINQTVVEPCRCDAEKLKAQKRLYQIYSLPSSARVMLSARQGVEQMERCARVSPLDVDMYMTLAGFQRVLGRSEEALVSYRTALRYDRRPEIFLNIGLIELDSGRLEAAIPPLVTACRFNVNFINEVPEGYREIVVQRLHAEEARELAAATSR